MSKVSIKTTNRKNHKIIKSVKTGSAFIIVHCLTACGATGPIDLSGDWETQSPVPYITEFTPEKHHGKPIAHEDARLLERSASLSWSLVQRPDGLVTGTNSWEVHDENGQVVFSDTEPMLGTWDGKRLVLVEPEDEGPQLRFELTLDGANRLVGVAHGIGSNRLLAMRLELIRTQ